MNFKKIIVIILIMIAQCAWAASIKSYVDINMDGNYISNCPIPFAESHAVNKFYAYRLYTQNAKMAFTAKCADGQITGYTPIKGEDLHSDMQWGVDWQTNSRFVADSTGSNIYDNLTGLIWMKNISLTTKTWTNAIDYCTNLVYGSYSDWRFPNRKELFSLVDLSQFDSCLPLLHPFVDVVPTNYWTSSVRPGETNSACLVSMKSGELSSADKTNLFLVWPVRAGKK